MGYVVFAVVSITIIGGGYFLWRHFNHPLIEDGFGSVTQYIGKPFPTDSLKVGGKFEDSVVFDVPVVIEASAVVAGDVIASQVCVLGCVKGNISAFYVQVAGYVEGTIEAAEIEVTQHGHVPALYLGNR